LFGHIGPERGNEFIRNGIPIHILGRKPGFVLDFAQAILFESLHLTCYKLSGELKGGEVDSEALPVFRGSDSSIRSNSVTRINFMAKVGVKSSPRKVCVGSASIPTFLTVHVIVVEAYFRIVALDRAAGRSKVFLCGQRQAGSAPKIEDALDQALSK